MAAIDKTYVNKQQAIDVIEWCNEIGEVTLENGYKFKPIDFVMLNDYLDVPNFGYNEGVKEYCLWNTPTWFDRWLWNNCQLPFIRKRITEQYNEDMLNKFRNFHYNGKKNDIMYGKHHYVFLKEPDKFNGVKMLMLHGNDDYSMITYEFEVEIPGNKYGSSYDNQTDEWGDRFGMLPYDDYYVWNEHHNNIPTKKAILRLLRRWNLPSGTIVRLVNNKYYGMDFEILVK